MVKLLSKLLNPQSKERWPAYGGPWDRHDPHVLVSRHLEFTNVGPYALVQTSKCAISAESVARLRDLVHSADYKCIEDGATRQQSHVSGHAQHKFDGVYTVFGSRQGRRWERCVCFADVDQQPPKMYIMAHFGPEQFVAFDEFLTLLEWRALTFSPSMAFQLFFSDHYKDNLMQLSLPLLCF